MSNNAFGWALSKSDLARAVGGHSYGHGHMMWMKGNVLSLEASPDGASVAASVASAQNDGRTRQAYRQTIALSMRGGRVHVMGYCTCPVGKNCKHVAAALLEHMARTGSDRPDRPSLGESAFAAGSSSPSVMPFGPGARDAKSTGDGNSTASDVASWLERVVVVARAGENADDRSEESQRMLRYILDPKFVSRGHTGNLCAIRVVSVRQDRCGAFRDAKPYAPEHGGHIARGQSRLLTDRDVAILSDLDWLSRKGESFGSGAIGLPASVAGRCMLDALLASGRLHFGDIGGPVLRAGDMLAMSPVWRQIDPSRQQLCFEPEVRDGAADVTIDAVLPLVPPYYVDLAAGRAGPIACALSPELALEAARGPVVGAADAMRVAAALGAVRSAVAQSALRAERPVPAALPLPEVASEIVIRDVAPTPVLALSLDQVRIAPRYRSAIQHVRHSDAFKLPVARLSFDYDGQMVASAGHHPPAFEHIDGGKLTVTNRQPALERAAVKRLAASGLRPLSESALLQSLEPDAGQHFLSSAQAAGFQEQLDALDDPSGFIDFAADVLPRLIADGWRVTYSPDFPFRIAEGVTEWWANVGEGSGIDWFSFELGLTFEGHRINLIAQLTKLLAELPEELLATVNEPDGEAALAGVLAKIRLYHTLPDGRLLPLPGDRLVPALLGLMALIGPRRSVQQDGELVLHRAEAQALSAFAERSSDTIAWAADTERLVALGQSLVAGRAPEPVSPPAGFKALLRPYQRDGLAWLEFLRSSGFGGVLADDMGLGKTVQALAFLAREKAEGRLGKPALIVAPTSVLPNWQAEAERFAPELSVLTLRGADRQQSFGQIGSHNLVLTTYPLLARDQDALLDQEFHIAILDEAQAIKNPKAAISQVAHRIKAQHRLALTGTPLENNLGEVWSLFEYLAPGLLGDAQTFRRIFRTPIEKHGCSMTQAFLSRRLKPFMLRRTKEEVATELPPKTIITERVRLEGSQRDLYETVRALMAKKVRDEIAKKGLAQSHIVFLDALLKLRQVCCDPRLLKLPQARRAKESAKLERLMEMVPELVGEGRRILLFSQFTSMLELIEDELNDLKIRYVKLTGDTEDRAEPVRRFQAGEVPVFLLSLKAGGTGLNLTAADTVIHFDPWWNPAVENQATDRAYRIGQQKPVFVYKLIVEDGIEEAIELLKARKAALADALFAGSSKAPLDLTEADISALFAPLSSNGQKRKQAA